METKGEYSIIFMIILLEAGASFPIQHDLIKKTIGIAPNTTNGSPISKVFPAAFVNTYNLIGRSLRVDITVSFFMRAKS